MMHEKKEQQQQQVMVVGKMRLEGAVVMVDEVVQVKVEYRVVAEVLPLAEGEEQRQIVEWGVGMCEKAHEAGIGSALDFQEHVSDWPRPFWQCVPPLQQLQG